MVGVLISLVLVLFLKVVVDPSVEKFSTESFSFAAEKLLPDSELVIYDPGRG
jgi:hypothetical protein